MSTTKKTETAAKPTDYSEQLKKLPTKAAQIRFLLTEGLKPSAICKLIKYDDGRELRPQHVYNTKKAMLSA